MARDWIQSNASCASGKRGACGPPSSRPPFRVLQLFAITAPGLERVTAAELAGLGLDVTPGPGGVAWAGDVRTMCAANLHCRTATRVIARLGQFRARTFFELERRAPKLPWSDFMRAGGRVALRVTARKSKLYHEGAIAERIIRVLADSFGVTASVAGGDDDSDSGSDDAQLVIVRFMRDECTISIDTSGALLHQRGYRQAVAKAPLRETIAAAMLLANNWDGSTPLLDPLCGSGTIPIEAALIARRIPPGLANADHAPRAYAFTRWPSFDETLWSDVVADAQREIRESAAVAITGSDNNAGAITAARANAQRAGVARDVLFERRPLAAVEAAEATGLLLTNAPYGVRVGERHDLYGLYATLGRVTRERLPHWTVAMLAADAGLAAASGLPLEEVLSTRNGGISVRLLRAQPAAGKSNEEES
jgi:putative N6-adenine-specific DNA methylase